jgi:hypothetical protein
VKRVCSANMPVAGAAMEKYCMPSIEQVIAAIESVAS